MGTKNSPGKYDCYAKAQPDEPLFVLLARDVHAPELVRQWVALTMASAVFSADGRATQSDAKLDEALACADAMDAWRRANR